MKPLALQKRTGSQRWFCVFCKTEFPHAQPTLGNPSYGVLPYSANERAGQAGLFFIGTFRNGFGDSGRLGLRELFSDSGSVLVSLLEPVQFAPFLFGGAAFIAERECGCGLSLHSQLLVSLQALRRFLV